MSTQNIINASTAAQRSANSAVPSGGQIGAETDSGRLYVADGVTPWNGLAGLATLTDLQPIRNAINAITTPTSVDSTLLPFADTSMWRLGIGNGATFAATSDARNVAIRNVTGTGAAWINYSQYSHPIAFASNTDPSATVTDTLHSSSSLPIGGSFVELIPATARISAGSDKHMHVITPDRTYVQEHFYTTRTNSTKYSVQQRIQVSLTGSGMGPLNGCRAYGGSAIGGLIRAWEIDSSNSAYTGRIDHPLAIALRNDQLLYTNTTPADGGPGGQAYLRNGYGTRNGYVWPATQQDYDSGSTYSGTVPMGGYFAIPSSVDITSLGLASSQALMIAKALQDYGAYVVDRSGASVFYLEDDAGSATQAFYNGLTSNDSSAADVVKLFQALKYVTNNTVNTPNGGSLGAGRRGIAASGGASTVVTNNGDGTLSAGSNTWYAKALDDTLLLGKSTVHTPAQTGATHSVSVATHDAGTNPTDDTAALQAMINAAKATNGLIELEEGRVYGATNLTLDYSADTAQAPSGRPYGIPSIRIKGNGARIQQLSNADFTKPLLLIQGHINADAGPGSNNKITRLHVEDLELAGLYTAGINGTPAQSGAADGLVVRAVQHVDFSRVFTRNFYRHGFVLLRQYFGSDGDEYGYGVKLDHCRSVVNGGMGFKLGDSTGAAVTVYAIDIDATANRLGGISTCSCNSVFIGGITVGNGNFGWQTVPTKQVVTGNENISTSADNVFVGCRSEQTYGWAEFDIRAGAGTQLTGCIVLATVGATCVAFGNANTGISGGSLPKPLIVGGYYSGNGSSGTAGQVCFAAQPTMYVGSAIASGTGTATLNSPVPLTIASGTALIARWYASGALSTATFTTSAAYSFDPTVRASATLSGTASAAIPAGAVLTFAGTDTSNPQADGVRIDYSLFAGGRSVPETMILGTWAYYDAGSTPFPTTNGAIRMPRTLATQGTPPTGVSLLYPRLNASSRNELVALFPDGLEHFVAEQADTASGFVGMPRESAYPMGVTPFTPTTGTFAQGHFIKNTTGTETGSTGSKRILLGSYCVAGGAPGTWVPSWTNTGN